MEMPSDIHKRYHTLTDLLNEGAANNRDMQLMIEVCESASRDYLKSVTCDQYSKEGELDYMISKLREYIDNDDN